MAYIFATILEPQLNQLSSGMPLPLEGFSRFDERIIQVVEAYLPHAAKALCVESQCLSCSHLIHRSEGSICRKANVFGQWPTDPQSGDAGNCQVFLCCGETEA